MSPLAEETSLRNLTARRGMPMIDPKSEHISAVLAEARTELDRADFKASLLLAVVGIVIAALFAAILSNSWSPARLESRQVAIWWLGAASSLGAIASLAYAVYPRIGRPAPRSYPVSVAYFADVARLSLNELKQALDDPTLDTLNERMDQLYQVSRLAIRKFRAIQASLWLMAAGLICIVISLASNAPKS